MFDWISDAVDWIGDGISSLWGNTIGNVTDAVGDWIWETMFEWLFNLIYGAVADLFEFINGTTSDIFELSWVQAFISLFQSLAWMLFVCGLIVAVFDTAIAYESGQANIKNTCLNVLKGFMAASLVTVIPQRLYSFCVATQGTFTHELLGNFIGFCGRFGAESHSCTFLRCVAVQPVFHNFIWVLYCKSYICKHQKRRYNAVSDSSGKSISVRRSEGLYRRFLRLVQAGNCNLSDSFFADHYPLSRTVKLYAASTVINWNLPVGNGSAKDCSDVRTGYKCES